MHLSHYTHVWGKMVSLAYSLYLKKQQQKSKYYYIKKQIQHSPKLSIKHKASGFL